MVVVSCTHHATLLCSFLGYTTTTWHAPLVCEKKSKTKQKRVKCKCVGDAQFMVIIMVPGVQSNRLHAAIIRHNQCSPVCLTTPRVCTLCIGRHEQQLQDCVITLGMVNTMIDIVTHLHTDRWVGGGDPGGMRPSSHFNSQSTIPNTGSWVVLTHAWHTNS